MYILLAVFLFQNEKYIQIEGATVCSCYDLRCFQDVKLQDVKPQQLFCLSNVLNSWQCTQVYCTISDVTPIYIYIYMHVYIYIYIHIYTHTQVYPDPTLSRTSAHPTPTQQVSSINLHGGGEQALSPSRYTAPPRVAHSGCACAVAAE